MTLFDHVAHSEGSSKPSPLRFALVWSVPVQVVRTHAVHRQLEITVLALSGHLDVLDEASPRLVPEDLDVLVRVCGTRERGCRVGTAGVALGRAAPRPRLHRRAAGNVPHGRCESNFGHQLLSDL